MKEKYGIIGYPLGHSLSPYMHSRYNYYLNLDDVYDAYPVKPEYLESSLMRYREQGINGFNITIPYKQSIIPFLYDIDETSRQTGAVNTLKYTDKGYIGYNTDVIGLENCIRRHNIVLYDRNVLILGAGGAARAAAYIAKKSGCKSLYVLNRTLANAETLCRDFDGYAIDYEHQDSLPEIPFVVIQATCVGMYPEVNHILPLFEDMFNRFEAAIDVIYNPINTLFIKKLDKLGIRTVNGFDMLIEQGLASRSIWKPHEVINDEIKRMVYDECLGYSWS